MFPEWNHPSHELGIREDLLVSLNTAQFDTFQLRLIYCGLSLWSLSTAFFSCCSLRKSLGTNFLDKTVLPHTSQLYVQIERVILSNSLSNTLRFPDSNLLVLPSRVYVAPLTLLLSSWMFTLKLPLFVTIAPRYAYSLQISRGSFLKLRRCIWAEECLFPQPWLFSYYYWQ